MTDQRRKVLLVDDSPLNITILGEALAKDYEIAVATNGADALVMAAGPRPPDLILLDIIMPGMDGMEVCAALKADPLTSDVPVIFITAMTTEEDETRGLAAGAVDYITKPFSIPIVKARVRTHVELKAQRDLLRELSTIDGLTGIANRRRLDEFCAREWKRAQRAGAPLSVVMADIDHFKAYNDTYGHAAGDDCLRAVAQALGRAVQRPTDLVARYGGEEFAAVLPDTDAQGARHIAEAMRQAVADLALEHTASSVAAHVTISAGTATAVAASGATLEGLFAAADERLYAAKQQGRNRVEAGPGAD
ncbi:diguanylate cyclase domain-containing protein [Desulfocurvus vexinensis]|uniref:diguanylate cyclase domain-containing protein n=1 Tax=Desulfocurvus vexinensis TaxID=399548 RepID=UPI00048F69BF|nr:diguanylate cyclase [Desulfocurvus vexinensis]